LPKNASFAEKRDLVLAAVHRCNKKLQSPGCHPERSRAVSEANGPAKSKDPYLHPNLTVAEFSRRTALQINPAQAFARRVHCSRTRFWVAQRFTAAIKALIQFRLYRTLKSSRFVSGYRFGDTISFSESDPFRGCAARSEFFSKLLSR